MKRARVGRKICDGGDEGAPVSQVVRSTAERAQVNHDEADLKAVRGVHPQLGSSKGGTGCFEIRCVRVFIRAPLQPAAAIFFFKKTHTIARNGTAKRGALALCGKKKAIHRWNMKGLHK
jgi:hypothetical protein